MKVLNLNPTEKVADYVERILVIEHFNVTNPFVLPLFANGTPTLVFQTAPALIKGNTHFMTLFGQTVFADTLTLKENFTLIAYFFKPFSLFSLFGISAQELTNSPIELNLLDAAATKSLQEQLLNAGDSDKMIALLDDYVFRLITKSKADVERIKFATTKLTANFDTNTLQDIQKELYMTERTFQRMFDKHIGISPNTYRRVAQFSAAFQTLNHKQFKLLTDVAFDNGYADQSHFIRSFKEFTNMTPKDYLKL